MRAAEIDELARVAMFRRSCSQIFLYRDPGMEVGTRGGPGEERSSPRTDSRSHDREANAPIAYPVYEVCELLPRLWLTVPGRFREVSNLPNRKGTVRDRSGRRG